MLSRLATVVIASKSVTSACTAELVTLSYSFEGCEVISFRVHSRALLIILFLNWVSALLAWVARKCLFNFPCIHDTAIELDCQWATSFSTSSLSAALCNPKLAVTIADNEEHVGSMCKSHSNFKATSKAISATSIGYMSALSMPTEMSVCSLGKIAYICIL